ncbi:MAG: type II toxin-antitoxin system HipA family toxin [Xanthomonadales bacterium]|nr:type II toxin-antitoxin system HipA family toxin [Xanthomonadales bacterium]
MITSEQKSATGAQEVYVWIWLPGATKPVVIGRLYDGGASPQRYFFTYGRSYLERENAIPLSPFELKLKAGEQEPTGMGIMPSCLRDGGPDAWGQRVLINKFGEAPLTALDFFLLSGSDRIGALDFQSSSAEYRPRIKEVVDMDVLIRAAEMVEKRQPLSPDLDTALLHGSSVGGARPKALIDDDGTQYIAKFSTSTDTYDVVKSEFVAMRLADTCGLNVAPVRLTRSMGRDVLLVERFDRERNERGHFRKHMLSGLSILQLDEMEARYASYLDLADRIRQRFDKHEATLRELFARLCFNILVGNTDDHARNHAAFWDGQHLDLTPAYDICPQSRAGGEVSQAMDIEGERGRLSTLANARSVCDRFMLSRDEATGIADSQAEVIREHWDDVCDEADLPNGERLRLWQGAIMNPFAFENWQP